MTLSYEECRQSRRAKSRLTAVEIGVLVDLALFGENAQELRTVSTETPYYES